MLHKDKFDGTRLEKLIFHPCQITCIIYLEPTFEARGVGFEALL
ncbi:hypothetical protein NARC_10218 [Candidatus Nitrosocosmicus arcticus]|uniref:Uncharacterized protein n=1 Tax=Candidatus Nitrosocosmicus arcticus TaxID=2035267 RepID=A0A557SYX9_9ARCH|nr:hypothetical protein NARC_10218 [Candidatus Nitrosocosmicus arcticus]